MPLRKPSVGINRHPLAASLWDELKAGKGICEADLRDTGYHLDGLCDGSTIYVNPAPGVVESLLHELVHRVRPKFGERRVLAESRRMLSLMTEQELRKWYRTFQRVAKKRAKPVRLDE